MEVLVSGARLIKILVTAPRKNINKVSKILEQIKRILAILSTTIIIRIDIMQIVISSSQS